MRNLETEIKLITVYAGSDEPYCSDFIWVVFDINQARALEKFHKLYPKYQDTIYPKTTFISTLDNIEIDLSAQIVTFDWRGKTYTCDNSNGFNIYHNDTNWQILLGQYFGFYNEDDTLCNGCNCGAFGLSSKFPELSICDECYTCGICGCDTECPAGIYNALRTFDYNFIKTLIKDRIWSINMRMKNRYGHDPETRKPFTGWCRTISRVIGWTLQDFGRAIQYAFRNY